MMKSVLCSLDVSPVLSSLVLLCLGIIGIGMILKKLKQPYAVAYILAGVFMGPFGIEVVTDEALISSMGEFGLILLLFFVGMEISLAKLMGNWKISAIGTVLQVVFSIAAVFLIGYFLAWEFNRIVMLGFVISLSSTAVVIKILQDRNETKTRIGQNVIGILLAQDVLIVPMLITLNYFSGEETDAFEIGKQIVGGILIIGVVAWVIKKKKISFPFEEKIKKDHEIQVFIAFAICFGFSLITAFFGLSPALGAFVAGILVSSAQATKWVHESLHSFRVVFVALFFVSVGMLIDLGFLKENLWTVLLLVGVVFILNNLINSVVMRIFKMSWQNSLYAGAILAQIGEFSFILGATGYQMGLIQEFTYQLVISIISISLVVSPLWIAGVRTLVLKKK